jgi:hypothetical protein
MAVRDHPDRPPTAQRHALTMLALRLNWKTGSGYVSTGQLAQDSDAEERTIRRATKWARDAGLLTMTRRGHRLGNGQIAASEWQLSQPDTGDLLTQSQPDNGRISTGQRHNLNRTAAHHHQELSSSRTSSSARTRTHSVRGRRDNCAAGVHGNACGDVHCICECHR